MDRQLTHICDADPKTLITSYMAELSRRAAVLRADVEHQFLPADIKLLPNKQQQKIRDWCAQVPVLGFNSGKYDLPYFPDYNRDFFFKNLGYDLYSGATYVRTFPKKPRTTHCTLRRSSIST